MSDAFDNLLLFCQQPLWQPPKGLATVWGLWRFCWTFFRVLSDMWMIRGARVGLGNFSDNPGPTAPQTTEQVGDWSCRYRSGAYDTQKVNLPTPSSLTRFLGACCLFNLSRRDLHKDLPATFGNLSHLCRRLSHPAGSTLSLVTCECKSIPSRRSDLVDQSKLPL